MKQKQNTLCTQSTYCRNQPIEISRVKCLTVADSHQPAFPSHFCILSLIAKLTNTASMAPKVTHFRDLDFVAESFDPDTRTFLYTTFALIDKDDEVYFGQLAIRKLKISLEEYSSALVRVSDAEIYLRVMNNLPFSETSNRAGEQPLPQATKTDRVRGLQESRLRRNHP